MNTPTQCRKQSISIDGDGDGDGTCKQAFTHAVSHSHSLRVNQPKTYSIHT